MDVWIDCNKGFLKSQHTLALQEKCTVPKLYIESIICKQTCRMIHENIEEPEKDNLTLFGREKWIKLFGIKKRRLFA